jgi:hypothetical protein
LYADTQENKKEPSGKIAGNLTILIKYLPLGSEEQYCYTNMLGDSFF